MLTPSLPRNPDHRFSGLGNYKCEGFFFLIDRLVMGIFMTKDEDFQAGLQARAVKPN